MAPSWPDSSEGRAAIEHRLEAINQRVRAGRSAAYRHVVEDALARGRIEEAVAHARRYAESNPLDERAQQRSPTAPCASIPARSIF